MSKEINVSVCTGAEWGRGRRGRIVNACNPTLRKLKQRAQLAWNGLQAAVSKPKQEQANKQTKTPQSNPFSLQQAVGIESLQEAFPFLAINPSGEVGMSAGGEQTQAVKGPPWLETLLHLKLADILSFLSDFHSSVYSPSRMTA